MGAPSWEESRGRARSRRRRAPTTPRSTRGGAASSRDSTRPGPVSPTRPSWAGAPRPSPTCDSTPAATPWCSGTSPARASQRRRGVRHERREQPRAVRLEAELHRLGALLLDLPRRNRPRQGDRPCAGPGRQRLPGRRDQASTTSGPLRAPSTRAQTRRLSSRSCRSWICCPAVSCSGRGPSAAVKPVEREHEAGDSVHAVPQRDDPQGLRLHRRQGRPSGQQTLRA